MKRTTQIYHKKAFEEGIEAFRKGVGNNTIIEAAKKFGCLIFTDDFPMSGYARKQGIDVLHFTHIRGLRWGIK